MLDTEEIQWKMCNLSDGFSTEFLSLYPNFIFGGALRSPPEEIVLIPGVNCSKVTSHPGGWIWSDLVLWVIKNCTDD